MARKGVAALRSSALKLDLRRIGYKAKVLPVALAEFPLPRAVVERSREEPVFVGEAKMLASGVSCGERAVVEVLGVGVFWGRLQENFFVVSERGKAGRLFRCRGKFLFAPLSCRQEEALMA